MKRSASTVAGILIVVVMLAPSDDVHDVVPFKFDATTPLPPTFAEHTTILVETTVVVHVFDTVNLVADGEVDGDTVTGSAYWTPLGSPYVVSPGTTLQFYEGSTIPTLPVLLGPGSVEIIFLVILLIFVSVSAAVFVRSAHRRCSIDDRAIRTVARMLPQASRSTYLEEWTGWLQDLRALGVSPLRRLLETLSLVLIAAPRLALILRLHSARSVDE